MTPNSLTAPPDACLSPTVAVACALLPELWAVEPARSWARRQMRDQGVTEELQDDVVLVLTEYLNNAVVHGTPGAVTCALELSAGQVDVTVRELPGGQPSQRWPKERGDFGRGLLIVQALSHRCGYVPPDPETGEGRRAWAICREPAA